MNVSRFLRRGPRGGDDIDQALVSRLVDQIRVSASSRLAVDLRAVQIDAGKTLLTRSIVEMDTGEGKTLTTVIPACVQANAGKNVLVATANDYLADRDARWMRPVYEDLGLTVGSVTSRSSTEERGKAYAARVTYGSLREFGFDYLRDLLADRRSPASQAQAMIARHRFDVLIVDEADSVLIDEARTPLVITAPTRHLDAATQACYRWCAQSAAALAPSKDFVRLADSGAVALTQEGRARFMRMNMPAEMGSLTTTDILHALERAIWVNLAIHRDIDYLISDVRVDLIDEYTGRAAANRALGGGLHQAIEAREGLPLTPQAGPVARISVQDFVLKFKHLCGLTATAWEDRRELAAIYGVGVTRVPTHVPSQRQREPACVCRTRQEKWRLIAEEVQPLVAQQRAVLIGTRSVSQSEQLSEVLRSWSIEHVVLNARNPKQESETISRAGRPGQVTVATNMAGRGTDIRLDDRVAAAGGLHVIVSEPHAAARIDRQLIGRSARQGDPGSARIHASLEDEILDQAFSPDRVRELRESFDGGGWQPKKLLALIRRAQRIVSRNHRRQRQRLTAHEASRSESLQLLGLDPYLDPLPDDS